MKIFGNIIVAFFTEYPRDEFCHMNSTLNSILLSLECIETIPRVTVFIEIQCDPRLSCFELKPIFNTFEQAFTHFLCHECKYTVTKSQRDAIPVICSLFYPSTENEKMSWDMSR